MNDNAWYTYVAAAIALVLVIGLGVGLGLASSGSSGHSGASSVPSASASVDYVNLTIGWNPATGLDEYFPANFTVPSHTLVEFTITSFDNGTNVVEAPYNAVRGTVGGSEWITSAGATRQVEGLAPSGIAHTFTIMRMGASMMSGGLALNALVPPAASMAEPVSVSFAAYFNSTGAFVWNCMAPCDMGAMSTMGLMAGTVMVV
ncbi:MAG: hypothetical protein L3J93_01315 [Thermoplasmata archaeon]|nr:hypothetical protein [Thermoplasmata archaeon]